jgi:hypothetical protein
LAPDVVIVEAPDLEQAFRAPPDAEPLSEVLAANERHLVYAIGCSRLRLCVRMRAERAIPTIAIAFDSSAGLRIAAAWRWQKLSSGLSAQARPDTLPSPYQRKRLARMLSIYDALTEGASARDISFGIVFPNHAVLAGAAWKGSSERRHTLRLIATAQRLVKAGYRDLLLHR